ncbi:MAG TPA: Fic family protein [Candidatus Kapabacteria bacterium]
MDIRQFKAGTFRKQEGYKSFLPETVNHPWIVGDMKLAALQSRADRKLGELNAASRWVDDIDFFISMHIAKEATTSSRIEGTQTTIDEALAAKSDIEPERRDDWTEVQNYIAAMRFAIGRLRNIPLSGRLLKETHKVLLQGVRGKHKNPGDYRRSQNWLGSSLKNAVYVPPSQENVPELMSDLEKFLHNENLDVPPLTRIGIAHYQFESIHPFLDGNGRLGRLLITLYLVSAKILERPTLYLSDFFERNRMEYYDRLTRAREKNDLDGWLQFFLAGIIETSENSIRTLERISVLRHELETQRVQQLGKRANHGRELIKLLYKHPILDRQRIERELNISASTASRLLDDFVLLKILDETTGYRRNRRYAFSEYLNIFKE